MASWTHTPHKTEFNILKYFEKTGFQGETFHPHMFLGSLKEEYRHGVREIIIEWPLLFICNEETKKRYSEKHKKHVEFIMLKNVYVSNYNPKWSFNKRITTTKNSIIKYFIFDEHNNPKDITKDGNHKKRPYYQAGAGIDNISKQRTWLLFPNSFIENNQKTLGYCIGLRNRIARILQWVI